MKKTKMPVWQKVLRTVLLLAVCMLFGFCCGLLMVAALRDLDGVSPPAMVVVTVGSLYLSFFLHFAAHEFGHFLFGKLTGYRFSSYRLGSVMLLRRNGQLLLKRYSLAGTGGQCLMDPPDPVDGDFPYLLYNLGGAIVNLVLGVLAFLFYLVPVVPSALKGFFLIFALCGVFFALFNGIPLPVSMVNNDGRNAVDIHRSPAARRAFWIQMKSNILTAEGVRIRDMPAEWFAMPTLEECKNPMMASVAVGIACRYLDEGRFDAAQEIHKLLLDGDTGMIELHRRMLLCDRIVCFLLSGQLEDAKNCLDKEQRQFMKSMSRFPSVIRTWYGTALLLDKDTVAAEKHLAYFDKCEKSYPYPVEFQTERELMQLLADTAKEMGKDA